MDYLIHHMLRSSAERFDKKESLVYRDERWNYGKVVEATTALAKGLRELGVQRHDRVGVFLEPSINQTISLLSISQAGGVFVPIHHSQFPRQVAHIVRDCEMTGIIVAESKLDSLRQELGNCGTVKFIVVVSDGATETSNFSSQRVACIRFEELLSNLATSDIKDVSTGKDLAAILYTSGSTGKPKGVMLSHANVIAGASIVSDYLEISSDDRTLAILPFSFDAGLNQLMTGIQQSATVVLQDWLFPRDVVAMLDKESITGLAGVPPLWNLLVQPSSGLASVDLPHLRYVTNTGGAVSDALLQRMRDALPSTDVVLMYGLTEAFRSTYLPPEELDNRPDSMGRAIPNTEILVVDDRGQRCEPNEVGELVHHGPTVSLGYWANPELTRKVLRPHPFPPKGVTDVPKVCYSGDLVTMDEEGYLYFVGRRDNQIKCSGFRISPNEVEEILCQHTQIQQAAVIGVPDENLGQRVKAFVVPFEHASVDVSDVLVFCSSQMPRHMLPKAVEVIDSLPKTSSGKVDYPALRRLHDGEVNSNCDRKLYANSNETT